MDLVVRKQSAIDRRKSAILLTAKAKKIGAEITPQVNQIYQELEKSCPLSNGLSFARC